MNPICVPPKDTPSPSATADTAHNAHGQHCGYTTPHYHTHYISTSLLFAAPLLDVWRERVGPELQRLAQLGHGVVEHPPAGGRDQLVVKGALQLLINRHM